jgi:hypothetical protein
LSSIDIGNSFNIDSKHNPSGVNPVGFIYGNKFLTFDILDPSLSSAAISQIYNWSDTYGKDLINIPGRKLYPSFYSAVQYPSYNVRVKDFSKSELLMPEK